MTSIKTLAALLMAGAAFAACSSSDDEILNEQPVNPTEPQVYTMTIEATKSTGDAVTTRALSLDGKTLNVKWNEGEMVEVLQYINGTRKFLGTLTAAASDNGSTTLTGTVSNVDENEELEFYLHGYNRSYKGQTGVLLKPESGTDNSIETNYDYGIARVEKGGFSINGSTVSVTDGVNFKSEQAIIKFSFVDAITTMPFTVSSLSISGTYISESQENVELSYNWLTGEMENGTLTVEPTTPASSFYVALKAYASDTYGKLSLNAVGQNSINYTYEKSNVTLERGKFYEITVKMRQVITAEEAVDLGLSVKWAPMNVGATTETDRGLYFAWAGTTGYAYESGHNFSEENAPYPSGNTYSKYIGSDYYTALQAEDDAATANWGGQWRMPTRNEWEELMNNCTAEWKENYKGSGINGILFTSNKEGFNDKSIFLSANGYYYGTSLYYPTINVLYWSSNYDLTKDNNNQTYTQYRYAYVFDVSYGKNQFYWRNPSTTARCRGVAVRPVCP